MKKNFYYRFSGQFNSFLISSGIILIFKLKLSDFNYGLWGIITSLVMIFSILSQFIIPNLIEKDFIELDHKSKIIILISYFKLLFFISPIMYIFIYRFYLSSNFYFDFKYLIPLLVTLLIVIENTINISNKIAISKSTTNRFDKIEFFIMKYLRFLTFIIYFFYLNKNSFIYVLVIHVVIRMLSMIFIIKAFRDSLFTLKEFIATGTNVNIFSSFFESNTKNFFTNITQILFYNSLFIISSFYFDESTYADITFYFIIFNFCRVFFGSYSILLTPDVKKDMKKFELKFSEFNFFLISSLLINLLYFVLSFFENNGLLTFNFLAEINYDYIKFGIFHGFIVSAYGLRHYLVKFSSQFTSKHLSFLILNSLIAVILFMGGEKLIDLQSAYIISIVFFEICSLIFYFILSLAINNKYKFYKLPLSSFLLFLSLFNSNTLILLIILLINSLEVVLRNNRK